MLVVGGNSCCHGDTAQLLCFLPIVSLGESALGLLPAALIVTACCPVAMLVVGETPVVMVTVAGVGVPDTDSSLLTVCNMAPLCTVMVWPVGPTVWIMPPCVGIVIPGNREQRNSSAAARQNKQIDVCAWQGLWSTQSDQSLLSTRRNLGSLATHWGHSEDSDQNGQNSDQTRKMPRLIWVFPVSAFCWFVLLQLRWFRMFHNRPKTN